VITLMKKKMKPIFDQIFKNYDLVTIPKAGHWVHADDPTTFVQHVSDFLKKQH